MPDDRPVADEETRRLAHQAADHLREVNRHLRTIQDQLDRKLVEDDIAELRRDVERFEQDGVL